MSKCHCRLIIFSLHTCSKRPQMFYRMVFKIIPENSAYWGSQHAEPCQTQLGTAANNLIRPSTQPNSWLPVQMTQASSLVDQWAYIGSYTRSWVATYCARGFGGGKRSRGWFFPVPAKGFEPPTCLRSLAGGHPDQRLTVRPLTPTGSAVCKICLFTLSFFYTVVRKLLLSSQWCWAYDHVRFQRFSEWVKHEES